MTTPIEDKKIEAAEKANPVFANPMLGRDVLATAMQSVGASGDAYLSRRGVSNGTVEDGLGVTVKVVIDGLDRVDGNQDGIIARDSLKRGYEAIAGGAAKMAMEHGVVPSYEQLRNFGKAMTEATEMIDKLPEHFTIPDAAQDAAVRKAVRTIDTNGNGRISGPEANALPVAQGALHQLVKDLAQSAVPAKPAEAKIEFWRFKSPDASESAASAAKKPTESELEANVQKYLNGSKPPMRGAEPEVVRPETPQRSKPQVLHTI